MPTHLAVLTTWCRYRKRHFFDHLCHCQQFHV